MTATVPYYSPREARRLAEKDAQLALADIAARATAPEPHHAPNTCHRCGSRDVSLPATCRKCLEEVQQELKEQLEQLGHMVVLADDSDLGYGPPAVYVRRAGPGAELEVLWGPISAVAALTREDLLGFQRALPAVLGQLFALGEDERVDELLRRHPGHDLSETVDTIRLRLAGKRSHLELSILRCDDATAQAFEILLRSGQSKVTVALGAYELLDLHEATCAVLEEIEQELRLADGQRRRRAPGKKPTRERRYHSPLVSSKPQ